MRPGNIIQIALDSIENAHLCNPYRLYEYVRSKVKSTRTRYYALIDEIQMCEEVPNGIPGSKGTVTFYDTLNRLMKIPNLDVYVTGSNAKMLSDDVATHFRDRGKVIRLHPLSFSEYLPASGKDALLAFQEYLNIWWNAGDRTAEDATGKAGVPIRSFHDLVRQGHCRT